MEDTDKVLSRILELLETEKKRPNWHEWIKPIITSLIVALVLSIFAWANGIGQSSQDIRDLLKEYKTRQNTIVNDANYNFEAIGKKLDISLKEIE